MPSQSGPAKRVVRPHVTPVRRPTVDITATVEVARTRHIMLRAQTLRARLAATRTTQRGRGGA